MKPIGNAQPNGSRKRRPSRTWHRWLGFIVLVPLLFVSVTGLLLNHTRELGWDDRRVAADWLLTRYGMELEGEPVTFTTAGRFVSEWGGQLFWDGASLDVEGSLKGVVEVDGAVAVVCERVVYVYDRDGSLIEEMGDESLPEGQFARAGLSDTGRLVLLTAAGKAWAFSRDLLEYALLPGGAARWSEPMESARPLRVAMKDAYRGEGLAWSRVLVDLHSGRFFGVLGRWLVDLTVVLVVLLSLTGVVLGLRAARTGEKI